MSFEIEVCIDNPESLHSAIAGGATRIELCSSLALGGLTPSYGFMQYAAHHSSVPVYAMIRPRQGDFLYSPSEQELMLADIHAAYEAGVAGIVFGCLQSNGQIDQTCTQNIMNLVHELQLGSTFHRAIDQCRDHNQAIEILKFLGCERILTSGLAASAEQGIDTLTAMVEKSQGDIAIMAGAGVNAGNVGLIVQETGVKEVHLSGKTVRPSQMYFQSADSHMGTKDLDDYQIPVTGEEHIANLVHALQQY